MKWFAIIVCSIALILSGLPATDTAAETYIWTDRNGRMVVSSEKPSKHMKNFEILGATAVAEEDEPPPSDQAENIRTRPSYDKFSPLILETIKKAARRRRPDNKQAQEGMVAHQVKACQYLNTRYLEFPSDVHDRIRQDVEYRWPDDYERQAAHIERQYHSYRAISAYENLRLTNANLDMIKEDAAEKWPYDYVKQERFMRRMEAV